MHKIVRDGQGVVNAGGHRHDPPLGRISFLDLGSDHLFDLHVKQPGAFNPDEIVERFAGRYPDHVGLADLRENWRERWPAWVKKGFFTDIDGWPVCTIRRGKGQGLGREKATYLPEPTLERLDRILLCLHERLSEEQTLLALEQKIPSLRLRTCRSPWTFKVTLTRPLLLLLDAASPSKRVGAAGEVLRNKLQPPAGARWAPSTNAAAAEPAASIVYQELWGWNPKTEAVWNKLQAQGLDTGRIFEHHPSARHVTPLGFYIDPPEDERWYLDDWLSLDPREATTVTRAVRSALVVPAGVATSAWVENCLKTYAQPDYKIEITPHGQPEDKELKAPPAIYDLLVEPSTTPMTFLKQVAAHALAIDRLGRDKWLRRCEHYDSCSGLFPADHPTRRLCDHCR